MNKRVIFDDKIKKEITNMDSSYKLNLNGCDDDFISQATINTLYDEYELWVYQINIEGFTIDICENFIGTIETIEKELLRNNLYWHVLKHKSKGELMNYNLKINDTNILFLSNSKIGKETVQELLKNNRTIKSAEKITLRIKTKSTKEIEANHSFFSGVLEELSENNIDVKNVELLGGSKFTEECFKFAKCIYER